MNRVTRLQRYSPTFEWIINLDVYEHPEKYLLSLPVRKVVADTKVSPIIVGRYVQKIKDGEELEPIIVFKHAKVDLFAVVDGHHRYQAILQCGKKEVNCTLEGVIPAFIFNIVRLGFLQNKSKRGGNPVPAHERVFKMIRKLFRQLFHHEIMTISFKKEREILLNT